jgi:type I restriction enzyme S subunit
MKWEKVKLGEIVNNLDSRRKPLNDSERAEITQLGLYPYIGANNIMGYVDQFLFDEEILCVAEDGGSWGAGQRCAVIYKGKTWVNNHAHVLSAKTMLDLRYLMHYLNYSDLTKFISGSTRGKLTKGSLEKIEIPLPPLHIQQQIADTLDKADLLRKKDQELLQKYDQLAQAIFYDMFGDPVRNEKGWEVKKLGDITKITSGGTPNRKISEYFENGEIPWVKTGDLKVQHLYTSEEFITSRALEESSAKVFPINTVLVALYGATIGACSVLKIEAATNQACGAILPNKVLAADFLYWFFRIIKPDLIQKGVGGAQPNISGEILKQLSVIVPPFSLQVNFLEKLTLTSKAEYLMRNNILQAELLASGLNNRYFS